MTKIKPYSMLMFSTYLFFILIYIEDTIPVGQLFTLFSMCLMLVSYFWMKRSTQLTLPRLNYLLYIFVFLCYCALTILWARISSRTISIVRALIVIFIMITVLYTCLYKKTKIEDLLKVVMFGNYTIVFYAIARYGLTTILASLTDDLRLTNDVINANLIGMCAAYAVVINAYFILYDRIKLTDVLAIPAIIVMAATESRKAFVIVALGILAVYMLKNLHVKTLVPSMVKISVGLVMLAVVGYFILQLPMFNGILSRMDDLLDIVKGTYDSKTSGYSRVIYNQIGMEIFREHPIFGIGMHSAGVYIEEYYGHVHLHNNFIELLACGGLVGFLIHYSIYAYIAFGFWKYRKYRDSVYDICLVLFVIRFALGYGYIQYFQIETYFYLLITVLEIDSLRRKHAEHTKKVWKNNRYAPAAVNVEG